MGTLLRRRSTRPGVALPSSRPARCLITQAPPPRRLPPPAGHSSGNPAQALPPGHTEPHVVWWRQLILPPPSGLSDAASQLERGLPRGPKGGYRTGEGSGGGVGGRTQSPPGCTQRGVTSGTFEVWTLWPAQVPGSWHPFESRERSL